MDEAMRKWIEDNLNAGYTPQQLRQSLQDHGMDPHLVDEYIGFNRSPKQIAAPVRKSKDTSGIFAFAFTIISVIILFASPFMSWISYETAASSGTITGVETPFGLSILFVSGSAIVLSLSSMLLSRRFSIGIIALSVFAIGIVSVAIVTSDGIVSSTKQISTVSGSGISASVTVQTALGIYVGMISSIASGIGGFLSFKEAG